MSQLIDPGLFKAEEGDTGERPFASPYAEARPSGQGFKDPRGLGVVVIVATGFSMLCNILFGLALVVLRDGDELISALVGLAALVMLLGLILRTVTLMTWVYRSNKNARAVSSGIETTPGWAVGFFFVPVLSWFRPYQTMSEIWRSALDPTGWRSAKDPVRLKVWWGLWVAASVFGIVSNFAERADPGAGPFFCLSLIAGLAANVILIGMVHRISRSQWEFRETSVFD